MTPEEVLQTQFGGPDSGIFTDGSCDPNPGPGGWGWVWVENGEIIEQGHGREPDTTNNRMELRALIEAFKRLPDDRELVVLTDSQLCANTINEWAPGWERRGWKRKSGPIKNLDLVQELYALALGKPSIELRWIRAHEGSRWNEYADALAALS
ncbi:MAG: ribonuclease HI [Deltaproteobacteria bacterium]|nr:ribonuclease HI [Deltaproteobacteria bacterium]